MNSKLINIFLTFLLLSPLFAQNYSAGNTKTDLTETKNESLNNSNSGSFYFTTFASKDKITLRWKVEKRKQPLGYKILRSEDGKGNFVLISSYESNPRLSRLALLTDNTQSYFIDLAVVPGTTYWYKLVCFDSNDKTTEQGPVSASVPIQQQTSENVFTVSPNTFRFEPIHNSSQDVSTFRLDLPNYFESNHPAKISIFDPQGESLKTIFNGSMEAGSYQLVWKGDTVKGDIVREGVFIAVFENDVVREATKLILIK
jgi:hypothetical protein